MNSSWRLPAPRTLLRTLVHRRFNNGRNPVATTHYDLVVIGSGPAAKSCAVESAKAGKKVAVVDKKGMIGGVCVHTGTIPSKTFREAVLHLTGFRHQGFYGQSVERGRRMDLPDILAIVKKVESAEQDMVNYQLNSEGVEILNGTARFLEPGEDGKQNLCVMRTSDAGMAESSIYRHLDADVSKMFISADKILVACGTRPLRPDVGIPFDGKTVFDSDQLLWGEFSKVPRDIIVIGAGVIGLEYASMFNIIPGTTVNIVDPRSTLLSFADRDATQALMYTMRKFGTRFLLGETLERVDRIRCDRGIPHIAAHLKSGKKIIGDALLYCMGRKGNTDSLSLELVGIEPDKRGLLPVNDFYQTANADIYACGDVIGYPALASTSVEQGRRAAQHMWSGSESVSHDTDIINGSDAADEEHAKIKNVYQKGFLGRSTEQLFPYGIYTIPEISMVGKAEAQLTNEGIPYEVGIAHYNELAKGQMLGGSYGFLKLIFHSETLKLLGVHAFGEGSTEIIHIGQVVLSQGGSVEYFQTAVFNYPTLAEAYNVAARDGLRKIVRMKLPVFAEKSNNNN